MPKYVFNPITLRYEEHVGPRWERPVRIAVAVLAAAGLCWLYLWLYTKVLGNDLPKTAALRREAAAWQAKMSMVDRQLGLYETALEGVEERDDNVYRSIYGLSEIPSEAKASGLGGAARYDYLDEMGATPLLRKTMHRLDNLTKRAYLQSASLDEVYGISLTSGDMVAHIPAVPPLLPDHSQIHLSSPFGYRTDPVYGGSRFHEGQDFATHTGYPVYATGDGVVVMTDYKFAGYGNEIVIDHGFGYRTRYAHLSRIDVGEGMEIHRGDLIGAVGSTGKATGPHLHYEVLYKGNRVNPRQFMNIDMPLEEYRAMVDRRREESAPKQRTTSDVLNRSRK